MTEGCLSLPGLELPVERSAGVTVEYQDLMGAKKLVKVKGLLARVIQHEVNHLDGILFTDHVKNYKNLADYRFARIVFIGSDGFSLPNLKALWEAGLNVMAVITETDKPAGRGQQIKESVIKTYAKDVGIAVFQPETTGDLTAIVEQLEPDLLVLASYGKILPDKALEWPTYGAINVHPSLLPKYRGATPIQSAILNGETVTGVTIMEMVTKVDAGQIILQQKVDILEDETTPKLRARLAKTGAKMLVEAIPEYLSGQANLRQQNADLATLTKRFKKEDGEIDWSQPAEQIVNQVKALQPWPGTYTYLNGKLLKMKSAKIIDGKVLPEVVHLEGKTETNWADFVKGYRNQLTRESWYGKIAW